jgi:hypothetical protein
VGGEIYSQCLWGRFQKEWTKTFDDKETVMTRDVDTEKLQKMSFDFRFDPHCPFIDNYNALLAIRVLWAKAGLFMTDAQFGRIFLRSLDANEEAASPVVLLRRGLGHTMGIPDEHTDLHTAVS